MDNHKEDEQPGCDKVNRSSGLPAAEHVGEPAHRRVDGWRHRQPGQHDERADDDCDAQVARSPPFPKPVLVTKKRSTDFSPPIGID